MPVGTRASTILKSHREPKVEKLVRAGLFLALTAGFTFLGLTIGGADMTGRPLYLLVFVMACAAFAVSHFLVRWLYGTLLKSN